MGLDQYGFAVMPNRKNDDFGWAWSKEEVDEGKVVKIAQWRKHANLQGYMEQLWMSKMDEKQRAQVIEDDVLFNCKPLRLTFQDLMNLKKAVEDKDLPQTTGFFFGESDEEHDSETLQFIDEAVRAIAQDMEIYYDSWW